MNRMKSLPWWQDSNNESSRIPREVQAFPFEIVDYDTSVGMDALAKTRDGVAVGQTHLRYIEFKYLLLELFSLK